MDDLEKPGTGELGTTGGTSSSPLSLSLSRSRSRVGLAAEIVAMAGAMWASWLIRTDAEIPWQYRFWGIAGIWGCLLLPRSVLDRVATAVLGRFTPGNGSSGR